MAMVDHVLRACLRHPAWCWSGDGLQRDKLVAALSAWRESDETVLSRVLLDRVEERERAGTINLHVLNIGSSGSHWLEALLADAWDSVPVGEVYLPRVLRLLPVASRRRFLEALLLLHAGPVDDPTGQPLTHSAHSLSLPAGDDPSGRWRQLWLLRDPLDIVLSRTFRKPAFRARQAVADDWRYFRRNLRLVRRFYVRARMRDYAVCVSYEALLSEPAEALARLFDGLGLVVSKDRIAHAVTVHRPRVSTGAARVGAYDDLAPEYRALVDRELGELRAQLGYG